MVSVVKKRSAHLDWRIISVLKFGTVQFSILMPCFKNTSISGYRVPITYMGFTNQYKIQ